MNIYKSIKVTIFLVAGSILILAPTKEFHTIDVISTTIINSSVISKS